jgi:type II secretory pathway pseudopilin PulG
MSRLTLSRAAAFRRGAPDRAADGLQDGFTMVELVVAILLITVVIGGLALSFAASNDSALGTQRQAQALAVADQQIEHIRAEVKTYGFAALAMNALPAAAVAGTVPGQANNPTDPNSYVTTLTAGCGTYTYNWGDTLPTKGLKIETSYNNSSLGTVSPFTPVTNCGNGVEPFVVLDGTDAARPTQPTGFVTPKQTGVTIGTGSGTVYTYVTDTNLGCNTGGGCDGSAGASGPDAVRVTVAVKPDTPGSRTDTGGNAPVYVSSVFSNPIPSNQPNKSLGLTLGVNLG